MRRPCLHRNNVGVAPKVLFIYNEHLATEALLGEAFTECGFDVDTFEVVPAERIDDPAGDVTFPDPAGYDVIVPLGARWPVYDDALRRTWVGAEMHDWCATPPTPASRCSVCASAANSWPRRSAGRWHGRPSPRSVGTTSQTDQPEVMPGGPWFQWHFDRWTLPPGATEIARTANSSQAFVLGRALALQFHPGDRPRHCSTCGWPTTATAKSSAPGSATTNYGTRTTELADDAATQNPRPGARLSDACGASAVSQFVSQRVCDCDAPEPVTQRLAALSAPPADSASASSRAPCPPSSSRGPNDGTGSSAGRCSTPASALV